MHLTLHRDGLEMLGYFALAAMILGGLCLSLSGVPARAAEWLMSRAIAEIPAEAHKHRGRGYTNATRSKAAFYCLCGVIGGYVLFTFFLPQSRLSLTPDQLWPTAVTAFLIGALVIFLGAEEWQGRLGWKHWAFWVATAASTAATYSLVEVYHPRRRGDLFIVLFVTLVVFFFVFGALLRVELCEAQLRGEIEAPALPSIESKGQRRRRKRRERRGVIGAKW